MKKRRSQPANVLLAAALRYAKKLKWRVFPLDGKIPYKGTHGHHDATVNQLQIRRWWRRWPKANVGIACDSRTGPVVIDIDGPSGERLVRHLDLPDTREARSRKGHRHLYFAPSTDGSSVRRIIKYKGAALDILGDGGYVVAPPSVHPSTGLSYCWTRPVTLAPIPSTLVDQVLRQESRAGGAPLIPAVIVEGERDQVLTSLAGSMRRRGASKEAILAALRTENETRCRPALPDRQLAKIARSISAKAPASPSERRSSVVVRLSSVKSKPVRWLVPGFLPLGKFVIIEGDPGQGKSTLTLHIAAAISRGRPVLGSEKGAPSKVVLVTYEDGLADTVRPRLDALGGDPRRVIVFRGVIRNGDATSEQLPTFPDDVDRLKAIVRRHRAVLVIVDPLGAALSDTTDSHKDASVRRVVSQLHRLAEDTGATVLGVRHLTKAAASNAVRAGGGSIAFIGAARLAMLVAEHPDDEGKPQHERRRVLAIVKSNLGKHRPSEVFTLLTRKGHEHPRIRWLGPCELSADDLNAAHAATMPEQRETMNDAAGWVRDYLSPGPQLAKSVYSDGKKAGGWNQWQLLRALKRIGGRTERRGYGPKSHYVWTLTTTIEVI